MGAYTCMASCVIETNCIVWAMCHVGRMDATLGKLGAAPPTRPNAQTIIGRGTSLLATPWSSTLPTHKLCGGILRNLASR